MKKYIAFMTALCISAALMSGCAGKTNDSGKTENAQSAAETAEEELPVFEADPTPLAIEEPHTLDYTDVAKQYEDGRSDIEQTLEALAAGKDAPCINITTADDTPILSKETYVPSVVDVFNCDEQFRLTAQGGIKVRGNSTADQGDEKPYRIKFEDKQGMLGLHGGKEYKSWVLLRSYWNLAPDYTAFNLAKEIFGGKYYSSDCMYVNLYINGEPRGIYLLCEQNQAADDRVDVNEPKNDDTSVETGYLIEMDNYPSEEHPFFNMDYEGAEVKDIVGEKKQLVDSDYSVKSDIYTQGQLDFIDNYTNGAFKILYEAAVNDTAMMFDSAYNVVAADETVAGAYEAADAVLDLESLADMLILEELVHNYDVGEGSFYIARDFTEESKYQKLTFMAPWDFNWAYEGSPMADYYAATFQPIVGEQDRSNPWFIVAMNADWFKDIVKERWNTLSENGSIELACSNVIAGTEALRNDLGEEDAWRIDKAADIVNFVLGRKDFLDKQWLG